MLDYKKVIKVIATVLQYHREILFVTKTYIFNSQVDLNGSLQVALPGDGMMYAVKNTNMFLLVLSTYTPEECDESVSLFHCPLYPQRTLSSKIGKH